MWRKDKTQGVDDINTSCGNYFLEIARLEIDQAVCFHLIIFLTFFYFLTDQRKKNLLYFLCTRHGVIKVLCQFYYYYFIHVISSV